MKRDARISALEAELVCQKHLTDDLKLAVASSNPQPVSEKQLLSVVVAGDSIVKHVDVSDLSSGTNKLICSPGARPHKVLRDIALLAESSKIENLVLHVGTNNIPMNINDARRGQPPLHIAAELKQSLKTIQLQNPSTKVHFSA